MQELFASRPYTSNDYAMVASWWEAHKWPIIPPAALPQTGVVITHAGAGLCAGFLYKTDSCIVWLEWIVSSPTSDKLVRRAGLDLLIGNLCQLAGGYTVFTAASHPALIERYKAHGFAPTDEKMTHMIRGSK